MTIPISDSRVSVSVSCSLLFRLFAVSCLLIAFRTIYDLPSCLVTELALILAPRFSTQLFLWRASVILINIGGF
jgi:hypothetical protein